MIDIKDARECCGCGACVQRCPKQCISFNEDSEGFRYPEVDQTRCIHCDLCERVCPVINVPPARDIERVYAAVNPDAEVRRESSSGGVFGAIARGVLERGGVVFGARFDENWEVCHDSAETPDALEAFRSSKYMQSRMGDCYARAESFLKQGREVLFTGTPCQIAGLRGFLRKDYPGLTAVDVICHGVPSARVWRLYLRQLLEQGLAGGNAADITAINFRAKPHGWLQYCMRIDTRQGSLCVPRAENPYMKVFLHDVSLRPICYVCPFKGGCSGSAFTLADFWGIQHVDPAMHDDLGTSMIIVHDAEAAAAAAGGLTLKEEPADAVARYNGSYFRAATPNGNRRLFFSRLNKSSDVAALMRRCASPTRLQRAMNLVYRKLHSK